MSFLSTKLLLGLVLGGGLGYAWHLAVGCPTGGCPITANPYTSVLYGMLMGGLLTSS